MADNGWGRFRRGAEPTSSIMFVMIAIIETIIVSTRNVDSLLSWVACILFSCGALLGGSTWSLGIAGGSVAKYYIVLRTSNKNEC